MFVVIVTGSAAVYGLAQDKGYATLLVLVPTVAGALDMTFNFSIRARHHADLAKRFLELVAEAVGPDAASRSTDLNRKLFLLYAQEPPAHKALDALCHNQLCAERGTAAFDTQGLRVPFVYRLLRHVCRFEGTTFRPLSPGAE